MSLKSICSKAIQAWDHFWFAPKDLLGLALMRILLCGTLLGTYIVRQFNMEYYSDQSFIPRNMIIDLFPDGFKPGFIWFFWPDSWASGMHLVLIGLLALLTVGIGGRWIAWAAWVIDIAFMQRNYAANFGADVIGSIFLFYLAFTQSCERLSIVSLWKKKTQFKMSDTVSSFFMRMIQIQICIIYAYTGFEKLKGGTWWEGTALWSVFANPQMVAFDLTFFRYLPWLVSMIGFVTILFESYFPVMMLNKNTRYPWLVMGVGFHVGIAAMMGLWPFSLGMISTYFLFIEPQDFHKMGLKIAS
jgi:hypothetical protein